MSAIIDVGCATHPDEDSIGILIERFAPDKIYGFDPISDSGVHRVGNTEVVVLGAAMWIYDGFVPFRREGSRSRVVAAGVTVPCVDIARFVPSVDEQPVMLKIDAEGAEYDLLERLSCLHVDALLDLAWVEWHPQYDPGREREQAIREALKCPLEDWHH